MDSMKQEKEQEVAIVLEPSGGGRLPARRARALQVAAAVLVAAGGMWGASAFSRRPPPPPAQAPGLTISDDRISLTPDAPQWKVLKLSEAVPCSTTWTEPIPARIRIDETHASRIGTPLGGRVISVLVELGQKVKAGDPLFSVASPEIAGLRAEREKAAVDLEASRTVLERVKALVADHAVPAKEELASFQQFKQAEVALKLAVSKLESLRVSSAADSEFTVVATRDGVVVEKNVLPAQEVSPESSGPLLAIADLSSVWVVADLFESDAEGIAEGTRARIASPSLPRWSVESRVDMVSSVVDPLRHTIPVRVSLANPDQALRPNLYMQVKFEVAARQGAVEVEASALVSDGARQYLYIQARAGEFAKREVVAGPVHGGRLSILSGLRTGEVVVQEGALLLDNAIGLLH